VRGIISKNALKWNMANDHRKHFLFASDFDKTLTFNDTGYVLSELLGISVSEFEQKARGMANLNLVQQGAELSYLLLHDPAFHSQVRRTHLYEAGKRIRLKENIKQVYEILYLPGMHWATPEERAISVRRGASRWAARNTANSTQGAQDARTRSCWIARCTAAFPRSSSSSTN
jgi:hypothetical protein